MKLLVLGANSLLGMSLTRLLQSQGLDFHALATNELDLLKQSDVVKAVSRVSPSQIINVATYSNLEKAESDPHAARECDIVNTQGVSTLAQVCKHLNLPLLHHSSSYVFDGQKLHPYTEDDETNPVCRYGQSKWYGERAIRDALGTHIILRTDWMFSRVRDTFFRMHIEACKKNRGRLEIMNHRFSPTPASDVARVLLAIARQVDCAAEVWGTYHYCALQPQSQESFVEHFLNEAAKYDLELAACLPALQITRLPVQKPYTPNTVLSTHRLFETFGIKQRSRAAELNAVIQGIYNILPQDEAGSLAASASPAIVTTPELTLPPDDGKRQAKDKGKTKARSGRVRKSADSARPAKKDAVQKESPQS